MPTTAATAIIEAQANHRLRYAMDHLLHNLRKWVRIYPMRETDIMPEHDIAWMTGVSGDGAGPIVLEAIKMHPELWADAIPVECCIVHRETLKKYLGADAAEYLAAHGAHAVETKAARLRYEAEQREGRERFAKIEQE